MIAFQKKTLSAQSPADGPGSHSTSPFTLRYVCVVAGGWVRFPGDFGVLDLYWGLFLVEASSLRVLALQTFIEARCAVHALPLSCPLHWVWSLRGSLLVVVTCRDVLGAGSVLGHHS
jgi:hypothetical protein